MEESITKIGLVSGQEAGMLEDTRNLIDILKHYKADYVLEGKLADNLKKTGGVSIKKMDVDIIAIVGSDRFLLKSLLDLGHTDTPILPIASMGHQIFSSMSWFLILNMLSKTYLMENGQRKRRRGLLQRLQEKRPHPF